ncbi:MAG: acylphosphatase [archaeon]
MICIHILVSGRVQGVWYRAFTKDAAERHGINGWVKNLDDGRVEALAIGEEDKIADFIDELKIGPEASRVDSVETAESKTREMHDSFRIL